MKTKKDWIVYLNKRSNVIIYHETLIDGKKRKVSDFYHYASEELKQDRDLNILNFNKNGHAFEVPTHMIDFSFIKDVYAIDKSLKIFQLPYEWKNNKEEKDFLEQLLHSNHRNCHETNWWFEPDFWSDIEYTKKFINYGDFHKSIFKEFKNSKDTDKMNILLDTVDNHTYYLKYLSSSHKNQLPENTILKCIENNVLKDLTKKQKDNYDYIKHAFHHLKLSYLDIDDKYKTPDILVDLLNCRRIWNNHVDGKKVMDISFLSNDLLNNRDIIKVALQEGSNFYDLKKMASSFCFDKELKKIALQTYPQYSVMEDCPQDRELAFEFLSNFRGSGITLFQDTKHIPVEFFQNKETMIQFLSIKGFDHESYLPNNAITALTQYTMEDLSDFIKTNRYIYNALPDEMKNNWELILPFYKSNKGPSSKMPASIIERINAMGDNFAERLDYIGKKVLSDKLDNTLEHKDNTRKIKI